MQIDKVERFESFILLIDAAHKSINKIKTGIAPDKSIKSVHTMWLYELLKNPKGLTATELANKTKIDRSLVSREIRALMKAGIVKSEAEEGKRSYNSVITLSEKGRVFGDKLSKAALTVQDSVSNGISSNELVVFYSVLERLCKNISSVADELAPEENK